MFRHSVRRRDKGGKIQTRTPVYGLLRRRRDAHLGDLRELEINPGRKGAPLAIAEVVLQGAH